VFTEGKCAIQLPFASRISDSRISDSRICDGRGFFREFQRHAFGHRSRPRASCKPVGAQQLQIKAGILANRMRDRGVLVSTDGPFHNVLKIKPPLVFTTANADRFVETLGRVLGEDGAHVRN
jgi:acetylornithine/succinyldiaminopimelate/putrescine aminotransferase